MLTAILEFLTFAFPKAGFSIGKIGVTISLLLFLIFCLKNLKEILFSFWSLGKDIFIVYVIFVFTFILIVLKNYFDGTLILFNVAQLFIILIAPLAFVIPNKVSNGNHLKIIIFSSLIVSGYAILQKILGITLIAVPGLSYTFGASLAEKPIGFSAVSETESNKMPSTYQNGNGMGIFLALAFMFLLAWSPRNQKQKILKMGSLLLIFIGLVLSGSRSILFPLMGILLLLGIIHVFPKGIRIKKSTVLIILFVAAVLLFVIIPVLFSVGQDFKETKIYNRYILQTINNPSSSRSTVWSTMVSYIGSLNFGKFIEFFIFGTPNGEFKGEGLLALLTEYGVIITFCFIYLLLRFWWNVWVAEKNHIFSFALLAVFFAFVIDQSFYYPPSAMNYFLMSGIVINTFQKKKLCSF